VRSWDGIGRGGGLKICAVFLIADDSNSLPHCHESLVVYTEKNEVLYAALKQHFKVLE